MPTDSQIPPVAVVDIPLGKARSIQRDPLAFLLRSARAHGDFIQYPLRVATVYQVSHPAIIQHVLQTNSKNYSKDTIQYNTLAQVTGDGLLTSDGRYWLTHRRLMQPAFHRRRLENMGDTIVTATSDMLDRWQEPVDAGTPIDIDEEMMQVTLEIVGQTLFHMDLRAAAPELTHAVLDMLAYVVYRAQTPIALPLAWPTRRNRRFRAAMARLDSFIYSTIAQRRRQPGDLGDMLSMLLQARDEETGAALTDQEIRDEMITLLIAGHETVASALTWCWFLLSQHPTIRTRLETELAETLGENLPTVADLSNLPYTRMVFEETLRLYPPAWLITRRNLAEDRIGAHTIPARSTLILSPYVMHRHPAFWPNPLGFDPERFVPEQVRARPRFAYIPFGGGPRLCIGDRFALMEASLILATVAQRYRLNLVPGHPVTMDALVTLRPRHGILMKGHPR